jgi:hypothetical protein
MKAYINLQTAVLIPYNFAFSSFHFTLISPHILLKMFLSKVASRLATSLFNFQDPVPYITTGLINPYPANVQNMVSS